MKKALLYFITILLILIIIKYRYSNYNIKYQVDNYNIVTTYKDKRLYYKISKDDKIYNFDIYQRRKLNKMKINNIKYILGDNFECIYPKIDDVRTYPLCYKDGIFTDYNLIESELLESYKEKSINIDKKKDDFIFYNNLNKDEYIALWNYKGYTVMNEKSYKNIEIFKKDRYDNTLSYMIDNTIYMADYDQEHEFNRLILLDVKKLKKKDIILDKKIDFDSYIVGHIKNNLYIYDNKNSKLYEINIKNGKTIIKGDNEIGFVKYNGKEFVVCSKTEYKVNKIKYLNNNSLYEYENENALYKVIKEDKKIKQKILENEVDIIKENKNKLYYSNKDKFYIYTPNDGNKIIFYNYELNFNDKNVIFVYINN